MRWPGIRDGNRRQGFCMGKGTGHDATSRHRRAPGRDATGTRAQEKNDTGDPPESRPAYRPDDHDPRPRRTPRSRKIKQDRTGQHAGARPRIAENPPEGDGNPPPV